MKPWRESLRVTLPYVGVGILWILLSDRLLLAIVESPQELGRLQSAKGIFYVAFTALLLQILAMRLLTGLKRGEQHIRRQRATLDAVVRSVDDVIVTFDRRLRVTNLYGHRLRDFVMEPSQFIGQTQAEILGEHQSVDHLDAARRALNGELVERDWRLPARFGARVYQLRFAPLRDAEGIIDGVLCAMRDVTDMRRAREQRRLHEATLERLYRVDALTECANRRGLLDELGALRDVPGQGGVLALLNIDHFKAINTTLGHDGGDAVLVRLGRVLRSRAPEDALVARLGGDEFAILFPGLDEDQAQACCENVRADLDTPAAGEPGGLGQPPMTLSIGLVRWESTPDANLLLGRAQVALQEARDTGRGRIVRFSAAEHGDSPLERASIWLPRIEEALATDSFALYLQPVVRLDSEAIDAWEVLLRLPMADGTLANPGAFLPAAERFGWMPRIDRWVFERAIGLLQRHPELRLFVNLSPLSLTETGFLDHLEETFRAASLRPGQLTIEFTETAALSDLLAVREWVSRLRHRGCGFALDDFGTGFSTFSYLRAIGVDYVKLDGSFLQGLHSDASQRTIVETITRSAQALGKQVVAEMVEDDETRRVLAEIGVDHAQGWLWAHPEPAEKVIARGDFAHTRSKRSGGQPAIPPASDA